MVGAADLWAGSIGSGTQPVIQAGDVIVGAQAFGFLRNVTSASVAGPSYSLQTEAAVLDDLIADGEFAFTADLFESGQAVGIGPGSLRGRGSQPIGIRYGPVVVLSELPDGISAAESLRLISRPRPRILAARVGITVIALTRLNNTAAEIAMAMSRKSCPASS